MANGVHVIAFRNEALRNTLVPLLYAVSIASGILVLLVLWAS